MDVKSRRFKYQSGRVGDEAKKRKSPAKSVELAAKHIRAKLFKNRLALNVTNPGLIFFNPAVLVFNLSQKRTLASVVGSQVAQAPVTNEY
mgnify:CR=1 FL=1